MPDRLRFSGPELSDLLDRVVAEHGETAAISAVNRVRSGGVAGFFCREEFEILVDPVAESEPDPESERDPEPEPDPHPDPGASVDAGSGAGPEPVADDVPARLAYRLADHDLAPIPDPDPDPAPDRDRDPAPDRDRDPAPDRDRDPAPAGNPATAPAADRERAGTAAPPVFAGPTPPGQDRFLALLERRLDDTSSTEAALSLRRLGAARSDPPPRPVPLPDPAPHPAPVPPAPSTARPEPLPPVDEAPSGTAAEGTPGPAPDPPPFWRRLGRAGDELRSFLPVDTPVTAVVGPLPLATSVVRRLRSSGTLTAADVIVLTDRAVIASEPSWQLVRNANRLVEAVTERGWGTTPVAPLVVIVDVPGDLPHWAVALQHRLQEAGVGLFRYPVSGPATPAELERFRQGGDVPYAVDLTSRVDPATVLGLLADRHPVVSVAGSELSPELLVALRRHHRAVDPAGRADGSSDGWSDGWSDDG